MKKSAGTDRQCIVRIFNYIRELEQIIATYNIQSFQDLRISLAAKYAVTQLITNIYELTKALQELTLQSLTEFNKIKLRTARQIASHHYDAIEFRTVYNICLKLASEIVYNELNNWFGDDN